MSADTASSLKTFSPSQYRYPNESLILALSLLLAGAVIALTAAATVCASVIFVGFAVFLAYSASQSHHQALLRQARPVTPQSTPRLAALVRSCAEQLRPGPLAVFVVPSRVLNAYTFGLSEPKVMVLYSALFDLMDEDELRFIIGHEMGHNTLGHTRLNSLLGGLAGIPGSGGASAILAMFFLWWNRTCELSADRAGLLACGRPDKAISALIKLAAGPAGITQTGIEQAYRQIDAEDDTWLGGLQESFQTHPMLIRRINALRSFAASPAYRRLMEWV